MAIRRDNRELASLLVNMTRHYNNMQCSILLVPARLAVVKLELLSVKLDIIPLFLCSNIERLHELLIAF